MSDLGFVESLLDNTNRIYSLALHQFEWYKKVQGTKCQVVRIASQAKYRNVFGSIVSSTLPDDNEAEKFPYVVLISLNDMKKIYQKSTDPLQFYDNKNELKLGDIIVFSRRSQEYKYKITDLMTFSEAEGVLYQYTMQGLQETNKIKSK